MGTADILPVSRTRTWREPVLVAFIFAFAAAALFTYGAASETKMSLRMGLHVGAWVAAYLTYFLYRLELNHSDREWRRRRRQILAAWARKEQSG